MKEYQYTFSTLGEHPFFGESTVNTISFDRVVHNFKIPIHRRRTGHIKTYKRLPYFPGYTMIIKT